MSIARAEDREGLRRSRDTLRARWRRSARLRWSVRVVFIAAAVAGILRIGADRALPDVGDPFDVEAFGTVLLPDEDNAYVVYRQAAAKVVPAPTRVGGLDWKRGVDWDRGWEGVPPDWRGWLEQNRAALELWRAGTNRPGALYHQPKDVTYSTLLSVVQQLRSIVRLARLEGLRLESEGDMDGALVNDLAILRTSRHVAMHGGVMERLVSMAIRQEAAEALARWARDDRVDARRLRLALDEVLAEDAQTPPMSQALKVDYLMVMREFENPKDILAELPGPGRHAWYESYPSYHRARLAATNDARRSRRVLRLLLANWLSQVDRPPSRRGEVAREEPLIFRAGADAPASARRLSPEALAKQFEATTLARLAVGGLWARPDRRADRERAIRARLIVDLASQLHRRERGALPESRRDLVGPYLKALPDDYERLMKEAGKP